MLKIFNTDAISRNARFTRGLIAGSISALALALAYGFISSYLPVEFSLAFIGIGYLIGSAILKYGRGVQLRFSIMGAILTALAIILADLISFFGFEIFLNLADLKDLFAIYLRMLLSTNINSLLSLIFRLGGIYAGFKYSRIV